MKNVLVSVLLISVAVFLAGCVTVAGLAVKEAFGKRGDIEEITPVTADLKGYNRVEVEKFSSAVGDLVAPELVSELDGEVIKDLKKSGVFKRVSNVTKGEPSEHTLIVGGIITDFKKPEKGAKRVISKASFLSVNVFIKDKKSGRELGRVIVRGKLKSYILGDEKSLIKKAAETIAQFVEEARTPPEGGFGKFKSKLREEL